MYIGLKKLIMIQNKEMSEVDPKIWFTSDT